MSEDFNPTIVTLCGSTRFKNIFEIVEKELALRGYLVISVSCFGHVDKDERIWENKDLLDKIHLKKIDLADEIYIIDWNGYIGESTRNEISYASERGKVIRFLSQDKEMISRIKESLGIESSERMTCSECKDCIHFVYPFADTGFCEILKKLVFADEKACQYYKRRAPEE